jgi:hypothetical protein
MKKADGERMKGNVSFLQMSKAETTMFLSALKLTSDSPMQSEVVCDVEVEVVIEIPSLLGTTRKVTRRKAYEQ